MLNSFVIACEAGTFWERMDLGRADLQRLRHSGEHLPGNPEHHNGRYGCQRIPRNVQARTGCKCSRKQYQATSVHTPSRHPDVLGCPVASIHRIAHIPEAFGRRNQEQEAYRQIAPLGSRNQGASNSPLNVPAIYIYGSFHFSNKSLTRRWQTSTQPRTMLEPLVSFKHIYKNIRMHQGV